jgi:hypothetical protein
MSLDDFCKIVIGNRLDRPVINKTGITQRFVFRLKFAPDETTPKFLQGDDPGGAAPNASPDGPSRGPSIFTALQERLGLRLFPAKGPGEFIVIDHVESPPKTDLRCRRSGSILRARSHALSSNSRQRLVIHAGVLVRRAVIASPLSGWCVKPAFANVTLGQRSGQQGDLAKAMEFLPVRDRHMFRPDALRVIILSQVASAKK